MATNNKFNGIRIEYHILQSFPVTCLNRDDVGSPKSAVVGGVVRQRVSSQCWKRQVRLALHEEGIVLGIRTKNVSGKILEYIETPTEKIKEKAAELAEQIAGKGEDTLVFLSPSDYKDLAEYIKTNDDIKKVAKDLQKGKKGLEALDIALFGRMLASATELNVTGAVSFAHAITTHKASSEADYFTALDDFKEDQGSSHIGVNEFSSGTFYRYVSLDLGILASHIGEEYIEKAVDAFTKALYKAVPSARQSTMAGFCPWDYAEILVRKGQPVQCSFDKPVKTKGEGYVLPSIEALHSSIASRRKLMGSLFGEIGCITYGESAAGIDEVLSYLSTRVKEV